MTLTITPNIPRDYRGIPTVTEGGIVEWRVASSDPALAESVQVRPAGTAFPADVQPQTLNFVPGSATIMFVQFQTLDDKTYEVDERFQFSFTPIGNTALAYSESGGSVANNDRLPSLSIRARENTVLENAGDPVFRFDITRAGEDLSVVTNAEVSFRGLGPTPAESSDFTGALAGLSPQPVRFAPGETIKTLELIISNDATVEATESLDAYFSGATSTSPTQFWAQPQYNPIVRYSSTVSNLNDDGLSPNPDSPPPPPSDVYRFYNTSTGTHFFTVSALERDIVINTLPQYNYEGIGFTAVPEQPGSDPIFRFYNTETRTHFFTPSVQERDSVIANLKQFSYEGVGFHASTQDAAGLTEVYRFYNTSTGTHFYTPSILERDIVQSTLQQFSYEGVGFWVPDSADYLLS